MVEISSSEDRDQVKTLSRPVDFNTELDGQALYAAQEGSDENLPDAQDEGLIARLGPQRKPWFPIGASLRVQGALAILFFLIAFLCCEYAALYTRQPGRDLSRLDFLDTAKNAILTRRQDAASAFADEEDQNLAPGEVRGSVVLDDARAPVDADTVDLDDPDNWGILAEAAREGKSKAAFHPTPADTNFIAGDIPTEHTTKAPAPAAVIAGGTPTEHTTEAPAPVNHGNRLPAKNDPDSWSALAGAALANKSRAMFHPTPADTAFIPGDIPTEHTTKAPAPVAVIAGGTPTEHTTEAPATVKTVAAGGASAERTAEAPASVNHDSAPSAQSDAPAEQEVDACVSEPGAPVRWDLLVYLPPYLPYAPVPDPPYHLQMRAYVPNVAELDIPGLPQRRQQQLASRHVLRPEMEDGDVLQEASVDAPLGILSARFESGAAGAAAVGLSNRKGGTCYGTFQIASGTPTFKGFLYFLEKHAPDIAAKLEKSGPANTGSTSGHLPDEWRRIASEEPKRFARLQYQFVLQTHYRPALNAIEENTGIDIAKLSPATQDVLWSTAVQHGVGGATGIFTQALGDVKALASNSKTSGNAAFEKNLIEKVYQLRNRSFKKSGQGMNSRFDRELMMALLLLNQHYSADSATTPDPVTPDPGTVTNRTTRPSS